MTTHAYRPTIRRSRWWSWWDVEQGMVERHGFGRGSSSAWGCWGAGVTIDDGKRNSMVCVFAIKENIWEIMGNEVVRSATPSVCAHIPRELYVLAHGKPARDGRYHRRFEAFPGGKGYLTEKHIQGKSLPILLPEAVTKGDPVNAAWILAALCLDGGRELFVITATEDRRRHLGFWLLSSDKGPFDGKAKAQHVLKAWGACLADAFVHEKEAVTEVVTFLVQGPTRQTASGVGGALAILGDRFKYDTDDPLRLLGYGLYWLANDTATAIPPITRSNLSAASAQRPVPPRVLTKEQIIEQAPLYIPTDWPHKTTNWYARTNSKKIRDPAFVHRFVGTAARPLTVGLAERLAPFLNPARGDPHGPSYIRCWGLFSMNGLWLYSMTREDYHRFTSDYRSERQLRHYRKNRFNEHLQEIDLLEYNRANQSLRVRFTRDGFGERWLTPCHGFPPACLDQNGIPREDWLGVMDFATIQQPVYVFIDQDY